MSARREFEIGGKRYRAVVSRSAQGLILEIDGRRIEAQIESLGGHACRLKVNGRAVKADIAEEGEHTFIHFAEKTLQVNRIDPDEALSSGGDASAHDVAHAPMPGTVISLHAKPGDRVETGQTLMIIESMKLETAITAWRAGTVKQVHVAPGTAFALKTALITLEATVGEI